MRSLQLSSALCAPTGRRAWLEAVERRFLHHSADQFLVVSSENTRHAVEAKAMNLLGPASAVQEGMREEDVLSHHAERPQRELGVDAQEIGASFRMTAPLPARRRRGPRSRGRPLRRIDEISRTVDPYFSRNRSAGVVGVLIHQFVEITTSLVVDSSWQWVWEPFWAIST